MPANERELRDPIHGFISRTETESRIIDTPVFQRLRRIRQLATAYLVYHGALHTRFEHSLGVMHVAGRMAARLIDKDEERVRRVRLAALLHDLGHGPFSHVSEEVLARYYDASKVDVESHSQIHEKITQDILSSDSALNKHISNSEMKDIQGLLFNEGVEHIDAAIISGPLDADKQDYLLRDSYFCGVKYGTFDIERLILSLVSLKAGENEQELAVSDDGMYAIEQFSLARYYMHSQVYGHKVRRVSDAMIVRALELGISQDNIDWLCRLFQYDGSPEYVENYLAWDDQRLTVELLYHTTEGSLAKTIMQKIRDRCLFKIVFSEEASTFLSPESRDVASRLEEDEELKKRVENAAAQAISEHIGTVIRPEMVIVKPHKLASALEKAAIRESQVLVSDGGEPRQFFDESGVFRSIQDAESVERIEVYAPILLGTDAEKRRKRNELATLMATAIDKACTVDEREREEA